MKYPEILSLTSETVISEYTFRDTILYALGLGMGADPLDARELAFIYEKGLKVMPTFATVRATGMDQIVSRSGIDLTLLLHGEERLRIHKPLPPEGRLATNARCLNVLDKGVDKGAVAFLECRIADAKTEELYATITASLFCRGDGGFGGPGDGGIAPHPIPTRAHDQELKLSTRSDQAALYRLSGDYNPLHIEPAFAKRAGYDRPILHGLCTYGMASRAIMQAYCDYDPARIRTFDARFSAPIYPGETLLTRMWKDGATVSFECVAAERGVTVLKNGRCDLS
jgi:acyl dehydratase